MSPTDLTTALTEVRDAVEAPPVDRVAFQARVRAERRRRTTTRAAITVTGLAAAAAVVAGGAHLSLEDGATPVASAPTLAVDDPTEVVGFVVQDRLVVGGPGGYTETDTPARNVLGVLDGVLVQADYRGALAAVPVDPDGAPGEAEQLASVLRVHLDRAGGRVVAEGEDGAYRAWSPTTRSWTDLSVETVGSTVVGFDGQHRVDSGPQGFTLVGPDGPVRTLPSGGGIIDHDLVAGVLAMETERGARFFDAATGQLLSRARGDSYTGRLSPDGAAYARTTRTGVVLVDPRTGRRTPVQTEVDAPGGELAWTGPETFVLVAREDDGTSTLQECDAAARACRILYEDPSGTLKLTS